MQINNYPTAVAAALAGDNAGFEWLYQQTYREKYYIAVKYMKNEDDANDVLQDAYIRAWQKLDTLDNAFKFPAWLGQIVANTAINAINKKRPMNFSQLSGESDEGEVWEYEAVDERVENQPELAFTDAERSAILKEMVDSLSDEQRMCVMMHYIEEIPIRDIAAQMGCSEGTIKSRLNYARKNLRASADSLEKKGYKFFGLAPMALLLLLVKKDVEAMGLSIGMQSVPAGGAGGSDAATGGGTGTGTAGGGTSAPSGSEPTAKLKVKVDGSQVETAQQSAGSATTPQQSMQDVQGTRPAGAATEGTPDSASAIDTAVDASANAAESGAGVAGQTGSAARMVGQTAGAAAKTGFFGTAAGKAAMIAIVVAIGAGGGFAAHKVVESRNAVEQVAEVSEISEIPEESEIAVTSSSAEEQVAVSEPEAEETISEPTPEPESTPIPEEITAQELEEKTRAAYTSYYDFLVNNSASTRIETFVFPGDRSDNPYETPSVNGLNRTIAFCDVTGDDVPEMIFYDTIEHGEYMHEGGIGVLSCENGQVQELLRAESPKFEDKVFSYGSQGINSLIFTSDAYPNGFLVNEQYGDAYWENRYTYYAYDSAAGQIDRDGQLILRSRLEEDGSTVWYGENGASITQAEFEAREQRLTTSIRDPLIMSTGYLLSNNSNMPNVVIAEDDLAAMTYDQALEFLQGEVSSGATSETDAVAAALLKCMDGLEFMNYWGAGSIMGSEKFIMNSDGSFSGEMEGTNDTYPYRVGDLKQMPGADTLNSVTMATYETIDIASAIATLDDDSEVYLPTVFSGSYSGRLTNIRRLDTYTYIASLSFAEPVMYIEGDSVICRSNGLRKIKEVVISLPGRPMPEEPLWVDWSRNVYGEAPDSTLPCYCITNPETNFTFVTDNLAGTQTLPE